MSKFIYAKEKTNEISFPLGGIGAGSIGLAGNGRLIDWEIFNRPNKRSLNGLSHFAVKAEHDGKVMDARILHGDLNPPYIGEGESFGTGFGWGPRQENLCGMPHFRQHTFCGDFPLASIDFGGEPTWPGKVQLHAWSPFIPSNDLDSSIPGAFFEVELENTTNKLIDYTVVGAISNPFGNENVLNQLSKKEDIHQLTVSNTKLKVDDPRFGDLSISTDAEDVSYQEYWYRGGWCDDLEIYWQDLIHSSRFKNRNYTEGKKMGYTERDTGHLAVHLSIQPGEKKKVRFVITWNIPNSYVYWRGESYAKQIAKAGLKNLWKNWYATQWEDSTYSGKYALKYWDRLKRDTETFQKTLFNSSLPDVALEAISANLSTLKTATCLRLEDGTFYGWEGTGSKSGSCEGSCTHVWNYAQALPFLFPSLERSMRTANYKYSVDENGGSHFRIQLPLGMQAEIDDFRPCADGQFGDIIKTYRDWKICGDTQWLREIWPTMKKTMEYTWSNDNPDQWDPNETGILWGRQHHTLDMELFGPNAWLTGYYLAALKAASEMANVCGEPDFSLKCLALFEKGKAWADKNLYNGEYYHQLIELSDKNVLVPFNNSISIEDDASSVYWSDEHNEIRYQVGEGCEIDMVIAQWHANLYGLGEIYNPQQVHSALSATYKHNFKDSVRDIVNPFRVYALNDEAGTQICSWPDTVRRPAIPLPYSQEDQGGYTYAFAIHMIQAGLIEEGLTVIKAVRNRYDGVKRNPWNEIECGNNYARAMASYALLLTYSGFMYDMNKKMIGFKPIHFTGNKFNSFWSLDSGWGNVSISKEAVELQVLYGSIEIKEFRLEREQPITSIKIDGHELEFTTREINDITCIVLNEKVKAKKDFVLK
ncbi:GH116 family glycosyl-hydrolase [Vallitalea okinawensis]|uniref:GH116 family glycosyl-hydrolase n=1 Tax=Vallitalea okinawensis TaxID=2078660 RepID=UPI000CFCAC09|nr:GH116 family glycosyl-hydrolase [Vallitalea okinawensis]